MHSITKSSAYLKFRRNNARNCCLCILRLPVLAKLSKSEKELPENPDFLADTPVSAQEEAQNELRALLAKYHDVDDVPEEDRAKIMSLAALSGPNELQKRLQILGFTSWTYAGFFLALILISLNSLLGTGWLGNLLGMNEDPHEELLNLIPPAKINEAQSLEFDYEAFRKNLRDLNISD